jgi:hypothetical protein
MEEVITTINTEAKNEINLFMQIDAIHGSNYTGAPYSHNK